MYMRKISGIQIHPIFPKDGHFGFCNLVIDNSYYVGNIGLHTRMNGKIRLVFPQVKASNNKIIPCFFPTNSRSGKELTDAVAEKYHQLEKKWRQDEKERTKRIF